MFQFILATFVALCAQVPEPPTDQLVLAKLPEAVTDVSITKALDITVDGAVWTCIAFYTEVVNGEPRRGVRVVYLEAGRIDTNAGREDVGNTPAMPKPNPDDR